MGRSSERHHSPDPFLSLKPSPSPPCPASHQALSSPLLLPPASLSLTWTQHQPPNQPLILLSYPLFIPQQPSDHLMSLLKHFHWPLSPQGEVCLTWRLTFHDLASACHFKPLGTSSKRNCLVLPQSTLCVFLSRPPGFCTSCFLGWDYSSSNKYLLNM